MNEEREEVMDAEGDSGSRLGWIARLVRSHWRVGLVILAGAGLRLACVGWGLPLNPDSDEEPLARESVKLVANRLNPHYFTHPSLSLYLHAVLFVAYYAVGRALGHFQDRLDFIGELSVDPTAFILIARTVALVAGIGTIIVWYVLAARLLSKRSALFLVALLSLSPLLIGYSIRGKSYSLALLLVSLGVMFSLRHLQEGSRKSLWLAAVFTGLAVSTNYASGFSAACPALAIAFRPRSDRRPAKIAFEVLLVAAVAIAAFLVVSPYVLLNFAEFYRDFATQAAYHTRPTVWAPAIWLSALWSRAHPYYFRFLANDLTPPVLLASGAGILVVAWRSWRVGIMLSVMPIVSLAYFSVGFFFAPRAMVFAVPFLLFFAAAALELLARRAAWHWVAMLALVVMPVAKAWKEVSLYRRVDNYTIASKWISENIPAGASVLQDSGGPKLFPSDEQLDREIAGRGPDDLGRLRREAVKRYLSVRPWLRRFDVRHLDYEPGPGLSSPAYQVRLDDLDVVVLSSARRNVIMAAPPGIAEAGRSFYERIEKGWILLKEFPADSEKRMHGTVKVYVRPSPKP